MFELNVRHVVPTSMVADTIIQHDKLSYICRDVGAMPKLYRRIEAHTTLTIRSW